VNVPSSRRPPHPKSVCEDWVAWLPAEKNVVFEAVRDQLEISYTMLSVALNEALALLNKGALVQAGQEAGVTADLFDRLAAQLLIVLRALHEQGQNTTALPNITPLIPENFRGAIAHRVSRANKILNRVLFSARSKFSHKLHALSQVIEELASRFRESAEEVAEGASIAPLSGWETLDTLHYDLNTCLRESIVVLKSFLLILPSDNLLEFHQKLAGESKKTAGGSRSRLALRHRRVTVI
jgi:hypothetical protein